MNYLRTIVTVLQSIAIAGTLFLASLIVLSRLGYMTIPSAYVILSGSMEPHIPTGSIVLSLKSPVYSVGDIITFVTEGDGNNLVTHRVVEINRADTYYGEATYLTKGDRNSDADVGETAEKAIQGKVIFSFPYVGYIGHWAKTPQGFILFVIVPATIIIYEELKSLTKEIVSGAKRILSAWRGRSVETAAVPRNMHIILLLIPLVAIGFIGARVTSSYFADREVTDGNVFGAAAVFPSLTPTSILTPTSSPTPMEP